MSEDFEGEGILREGEVPLADDKVLSNEESSYFMDAINLGAESGSIEVFGHDIEYTLLNIKKELEVAQIVSEYEGTLGRNRAYRTATVAAAVDKIDGKYIYTPTSPRDAEKIVRRKFEKFSEYYALFIEKVYEEVVKKELDLSKELLDKLSK